MRWVRPTSQSAVSGFVYDLRIDGQNSERFYSDVSAFSMRVLAEIESRAASALDEYQRICDARLCARRRAAAASMRSNCSPWAWRFRLYGGVAASTPRWVIDLARELYGLRRRSQRHEAGGRFSSRRAVPGVHAQEDASRRNGSRRGVNAGRRGLLRLPAPDRMAAGHRRVRPGMAARRQLADLLEPASSGRCRKWMAVSVELFDWFTGAADDALGKYTRA